MKLMSQCFRKINYLCNERGIPTNAKNGDNMFLEHLQTFYTKTIFFLRVFRISHLTSAWRWHFWLGRKGAPPSSQKKQQHQEMEGRKWRWEKRGTSCLEHQKRELLLRTCQLAELETILSSHSSTRERTQRTEHQSHEQLAFTDSSRHILNGSRKKNEFSWWIVQNWKINLNRW